MSKAASAVNLSSKEAQLVVAVLQHMAVADFKVNTASSSHLPSSFHLIFKSISHLYLTFLYKKTH